jgi:hypothetical protein
VRTAFTTSTVSILPNLTVLTPTDTVVYDGTVPGLDVTGTLASATVSQAPACPADLDRNGAVNSADLAILLNQWGFAGPADINGSGAVDASDLAIMLGAWGSCSGT